MLEKDHVLDVLENLRDFGSLSPREDKLCDDVEQIYFGIDDSKIKEIKVKAKLVDWLYAVIAEVRKKDDLQPNEFGLFFVNILSNFPELAKDLWLKFPNGLVRYHDILDAQTKKITSSYYEPISQSDILSSFLKETVRDEINFRFGGQVKHEYSPHLEKAIAPIKLLDSLIDHARERIKKGYGFPLRYKDVLNGQRISILDRAIGRIKVAKTTDAIEEALVRVLRANIIAVREDADKNDKRDFNTFGNLHKEILEQYPQLVDRLCHSFDGHIVKSYKGLPLGAITEEQIKDGVNLVKKPLDSTVDIMKRLSDQKLQSADAEQKTKLPESQAETEDEFVEVKDDFSEYLVFRDNDEINKYMEPMRKMLSKKGADIPDVLATFLCKNIINVVEKYTFLSGSDFDSKRSNFGQFHRALLMLYIPKFPNLAALTLKKIEKAIKIKENIPAEYHLCAELKLVTLADIKKDLGPSVIEIIDQNDAKQKASVHEQKTAVADKQTPAVEDEFFHQARPRS